MLTCAVYSQINSLLRDYHLPQYRKSHALKLPATPTYHKYRADITSDRTKQGVSLPKAYRVQTTELLVSLLGRHLASEASPGPGAPPHPKAPRIREHPAIGR